MGAPRVPAALREARWDSTVVQVLDSARATRVVAERYVQLYGSAMADKEEEERDRAEQVGVLGISRKYADLGIDGQVRLELRTERLRNERCSPLLLLDPSSGCRGGFRAPRLDNHVSIRSGGILGRRLHLNVDVDNDRDFGGNNNIQVFYEGLEDEIVRRVEVGTVTFRPPTSRFITAAIPANNFGVNASFEVGPVQLQALAATQKGSQVAERTYTVGQTTSQPQDRQLRDLDFESGRFYWVVDPTTLTGFPGLDILNLNPQSLPPSQRPAQVRVYRFRPASRTGANANIGGITALATTTDPNQSYGPVRWELLVQGTDYYLDPSGLWLGLATKLDQNDYLAVSYLTVDGGTVGSFPAADQGAGSTDSLRLLVQPQTGPSAVTFRQEMRQIYRVAGSDLEVGSLHVNLSVNRSERPQSGAATYLSLLGLSIPTDPNTFDLENRLFPRSRDPEATQVIRESYVIFPHLTPFADATRLTLAERADSMYRTPLFALLQETSAKFLLRLRYNSTGAGDRSTLNLGAFQLRDGSEQLLVRGRRLERGVDYTIAYESGQVTFNNPDALFGTGAVQVTARFEEQGLFAIAPTTILGMATTYSLGERGAVNLIGMYQREQSAFNRPALGFEASANLVAGVNTELHFKPQAVSRFLNRLTSQPATAPSLFDVNAEFAFTKPDPSRSGQAYLEEFEGDAGVGVPLQESAWEFSSRPQAGTGLEDIGFAAGFELDDAVALTWQNLVPTSANTAFELRPEDIDTLIRLSGREQRETAMFLTFHADTAGGIVQRNQSSRWSLPRRDFRPRWRSMVVSLSSTGVDLSRDEFLEFWVFQPGTRTTDSAGVRLVLDLGSVNEDAVAIAPDSFTVTGADTVFTGRQLAGLGRLDSERREIGTFNAQIDDIGILGDRPDGITEIATGERVPDLTLCQRTLSAVVEIFPWGDLSGRCTRGNGSLDTEDLNGDNALNTTGTNDNVFRYVVSLQPGGKYFVRDGVQTVDALGRVSKWELYRVPIRMPDAEIGTPNLRLVQNLRMIVVGPPDAGTPDVVARFALARMRFVGSPWVRRAEAPIAGLSGSVAKSTGVVIASVVSTENRIDLGYESPPGVLEQLSQRGDITSTGVQINEKSLRLIATELDVGDRAEAFLRFPAGPQNLLNYRELRAWMRGRGPGWEERELEGFIKVGSDDRNFYLYRVTVHSATWEPEVAVDLETWRRLRAEVQTRWLSGAPPSGAEDCGTNDPNAFVACDGPHLVHMVDPGINPPNLARVQELSAGIFRANGAPGGQNAELWVDDVRLTSPVSRTGTAVAVDARLIASDVGSVSASFIRQDGQFHQINTDPTYRTTGTFQLNSSWRLDRFLPPSLGLVLPVNVSYFRSDVQLDLLTGTDIRGAALQNLRRPESYSTTYSFSLRRGQRGSSWITRGFLDPFSVTGALTTGRAQTEFTNTTSKNSNLTVAYGLQLARGGFRLPFGGLVKRLPKWLRESEAGKGLADAKLSLAPSSVRLTSALTRDQGDYSSFAVPVFQAADSLVGKTLSLTHLWRNGAGLTWQPLGMLTLSGDFASTRDLRVYPDSTPLGRVAFTERRFFLGVPVGVERDRTLVTSFSLTPRITSWLRPRLITGSHFILSRTLNTRPLVRADGDSGAFILPQTLNNVRTRELGASLDLSRLLRQIWGDSGAVGRAVARIRPVDVSNQLGHSSTFDLTTFDPSVGYMLALGGLDRFLSQEGFDALAASETKTTRVTGGADLPLGITGTISYALTSATRFQQIGVTRSVTTTRQREWPVGNVRWTRSFRGGPLTLVASGLGFRRREGNSTQPSAGERGAVSSIHSSSLTPDVQLGFRNGITLTLNYNRLDQRSENSGNATLLDQDDVTGSLNYAFRLPARFGRSRKQVRSSVTAVSSKILTCILRGGEAACTTISDVRRQEVRGGFDTDLASALSAGLQFGYTINDARHLDRKTSQIFLLLSFQVALDAGTFR